MANILNASPNRMELMKLGKRLTLARRGHRLLKDKQDELVDRFTESIKQVRELRKDIEEKYQQLRIPYLHTRSLSDPGALEDYIKNPPVKAKISGSRRYIMNLRIPSLEAEFENNTAELGNLRLSSSFFEFMEEFLNLVKKIIELSNAEESMYMIAAELERVRRRVNALEYIFIPRLSETIVYISMQLEEMERENITRLMKIKDIVRKQ